MKVGTITFWWCYENYGQILQAFAFQRYLRKLGHEGLLIRYIANSFFKTSLLSFASRILRNPLSLIITLMDRVSGRSWAREKRIAMVTDSRDFEGFRTKYLVMSPKIYRSYQELMASSELDVDAYSVGSDVVWKNFPFTDDGLPMFLSFGRKGAKRFAYSASFGSDSVSEEYRNFVRPLLDRLDAIGVREASGVEICKSMGRDDAVHVLDPVLLLTREDYLKELNLHESKRSGIMAYYLQSSNPLPIEEIRRLPNMSHVQVEVVTVYSDMGIPKKYLINPTIPEWVSKVASSELFITNSFHGTAMAIIMHTPFVVMLKHKGKDMDARILSLLEKFDLTSRIYTGDVPLGDIVDSNINWARVDADLETERVVSRKFLRKVGV